MPEIPKEYRQFCSTCSQHFDARDLGEVLKHLHDPNIPEDFTPPQNYISRKIGESKEWLNGKEEIDIN